jgi:formylmethanofuran dehydrogenase subunit C
MTYETQWKAVVTKEWEMYKNKWEAENLGKEFNESRFAFMNSFIKEKYLEETEEVKINVRKRREELKDAFEVEGAEKNASYQR